MIRPTVGGDCKMVNFNLIALFLFLASFGNAREILSFEYGVSSVPAPSPNGYFGQGPVETGVRLTSCRRPGVWALTFDDGPSTIFTPKVLDALKVNNIQATFFVVGETLVANEESKMTTLRAFMEGHLIGSHTYTHLDLTNATRSQIREELSKTSDALFNVTGKRPKYFRPPFGYTNEEVLEVLQEEEYKVIIWNMDPRDWESRNVSAIFASYEETVENSNPAEDNVLSLSHDVVCETAEVVPDLITLIRAKGFEIVRVDDCLNDSESPYW